SFYPETESVVADSDRVQLSRHIANGHGCNEADLPFFREIEVLLTRFGGVAVGVRFPGEDARGGEVGAGALRGDVDDGDVAAFAEGDDFFGVGVEREEVAA